MKHIVEYKLWAGQVPYFVEDGGYWLEGSKMIGITKDDSECFIPKMSSDGGDLKKLTNQELIARVVSIAMQNKTDAEKTAMAQSWLTSKGF
jgi:hypothetical protein